MKIICLKGGLGNQMFEYCRYKMIKEKAFLYYDSRKLKQHHNILISDVFSIDMPKNSCIMQIWAEPGKTGSAHSQLFTDLISVFHVCTKFETVSN